MSTIVEPPLDAATVAANRAAWTAALRSGDYAQGQGALRVDDHDGRPTYCCLGVAEDVRGADWSPVVLVDDDDDDGHVRERTHTGTHELPDGSELNGVGLTRAGRRWLGLSSGAPSVVYRCDQYAGTWCVATLVDLNDSLTFTFDEIADVLDDQPADWDGTPEFAETELRRRVEEDESL